MQLTNNIKRAFLSFAQDYFQTVHPTLKWNVDPKKTKIFIGDKNIYAPEVVERMPSIILSRGAVTYAQTSIDQLQYTDNPLAPPKAKQRTDLVRGSVTYNCTSQNGVEAEEIANILYLNLVGFKDQFRSNGIHQIMGVSMGEEQIVRGDALPRLFVVQVNVMFTVQTVIITTTDLYSVIVDLDTTQVPQLWGRENLNFTNGIYGFVASGNSITFNSPPLPGSELSVNFTGYFTLTKYTNITPSGVIDGLNTVFILPENIYVPYMIYSGLAVYASGLN